MNIFEKAVKNKYRFNYKGVLGTEDLFDLSVESLDQVFKDLNAQLKQVQEESLLEAKSKQDEELDVKIEIVKTIFREKLNERNAKLEAKKKAEKKQKILNIIAERQEDELKNNTSIEDLKAMLEELEN